MDNIGIYLFALIVVVWPLVSYLMTLGMTTSKFGTMDDYVGSSSNFVPKDTVRRSNPVAATDVHNRTV